MFPTIIAIIQARMASSRLPGKVLLEISGQPMLAHVVQRARLAQTVSEVIVATTTNPSDDPVEKFCQEQCIACFRGSEHDVLDRYYQSALAFGAQVVVRLTADCPLIDSVIIDETVRALLGTRSPSAAPGGTPLAQLPGLYDFAANRLPPPWNRTYPIGLDVEVCTFQALERAWKEANEPHQREHVMPYLYEQPGRFRVLVLDHDPDYGNLRWTVDSPQDLELVSRIFAAFPGREDFSWLEVLALFEREPQLAQINAGVRHKTVSEVDPRR
ncbi:MAG TPA: glycosyltransferase family protein [Anaerolineales bacterium]|nr:glycosyltransferase family protein [Anaerolineales bacterium]